MPTLFKRSNGIYYFVTSVNGRRVWKSTGAQTIAQALQNFSAEAKKPAAQPVAELTLSEFQTQILEYAKANLAPNTVALYKAAFRKFEELVSSRPLAAYTPHMVEEFKIKRLQEVSPVHCWLRRPDRLSWLYATRLGRAKALDQ